MSMDLKFTVENPYMYFINFCFRVRECYGSSKDRITIGIDDGKWAELKRKEVSNTQSSSGNNPEIPPIFGWKSFPSTNLPKHFNEGHIHHYIIESVQMIQDGKTSQESDEEQDITDLHTSKPLRKGKQFFTSGHV